MYISLIKNIRPSLTYLHGFQLLVLLSWFVKITFFHLYQKDKSFESKLKFRQASNCCKRVLEAAKLAYANKTRESITSQKLSSLHFWRITNSFLKKGKSAKPPLFNGQEVLSSGSGKAKCFAENISTNSNLDDSGISLPFFLLDLIGNCIIFL